MPASLLFLNCQGSCQRAGSPGWSERCSHGKAKGWSSLCAQPIKAWLLSISLPSTRTVNLGCCASVFSSVKWAVVTVSLAFSGLWWSMMISFLSYSSFSCCLLFKLSCSLVYSGFPFGSDGDDSACNARDLGSIPGSGRSPGEGRGNPLQYSCLGNPMDRGDWWGTVHRAANESDRT